MNLYNILTLFKNNKKGSAFSKVSKIKTLINSSLNALAYYDDSEINGSISSDIEEAYYLLDDITAEFHDLYDDHIYLEDNINIMLSIFDEAFKHFDKMACAVKNYSEISEWLKTQKFNYYNSVLNTGTIQDAGIVVIDKNGFMMLKLHFAQHIIDIKKEI